jgi:hypothetical protein
MCLDDFLPVDTIEQLIDKVRSNEYYLIGTENGKFLGRVSKYDFLGGWFNEAINDSYNFPYVELKSALKHNPFHVVDSVIGTLKKIKQENAVASVQDDYEINYYYTQTCGISKLWMVRSYIIN